MRYERVRLLGLAWGLASALLIRLAPQSTCLAQGSLTPPGAPAPGMKTLSQVEPRSPISSLPLTITNPGSYYLTADLTGIAGTNGITVGANDVTIDLNGFVLIGVPGSIDGIGSPAGFTGPTNLTVRNGFIRNWGGVGVKVPNFYNCNFRDLIAQTNAGGGFQGGNNSIFLHCTANQNGSIGLDPGINSLAIECIAANNSAQGFNCSFGTLQSCTSSQNGGSGIYAYNYSQVLHCRADSNLKDGIALGYFCQAIENSCVGNNYNNSVSYAGIRTFYDGGRMEGNHVEYDVGIGILVGAGNTKWVIIRNSTVGTTNNAYSIPAGNDVGPWGKAATATSPWANLYN